MPVFPDSVQTADEFGTGLPSLERAASTLSTGERQRMQLARTVCNRATGVLYVLDEPSIGLHLSNIVGLTRVMRDLVADGNSVILVNHNTQILSQGDWLIEMELEAGANGGQVVVQQISMSEPAPDPANCLSWGKYAPLRLRSTQ